ncbi:class I SAM-dependent methyltransferase [Algicola sagamiensis]|uniref:class I SAM-dependent methyltransferase n=1 Tax=Algicola sagamiensis TaxID=163869 RepID=UPI00035CE916|nr:class I SAM-dependent methyltransferase [Algicola sagamiensis]
MIKKTKKALIFPLTALALSLSSQAFATDETSPIETTAISEVELALSGPQRSEANKQRDIFRHPKETLEFFGLKAHMTVVEIWPGGGWYTEVLAPILKENGTLYAAHFSKDSPSEYFRKSRARFENKMQDPVYSAVKITEFYPGSQHKIAPKNSADMVLTFRNLHNWYMQKDTDGIENALKAFYDALKPGGILGIVDHRLPENMDQAEKKMSGYLKQSWVIQKAKEAGFELEALSEINANPKDTADYLKGVWALPPRLANGEQQKEKYLAIGESDRMTLKFVKTITENTQHQEKTPQ